MGTLTTVYMEQPRILGRRYREEDHERNLDAVLQRISESGFDIRLSKCQFSASEVNYFGCIINKEA
ncbi:hypothetical protein TTRE_0000874701 [Trichuris trichiura]|uniref:Uncharacterized protein n=1 Tax=Trichuris trichiura TaxID=36087 RepID=A0A077ZNU9_TRITR|nr:hypothetical protein TTRE_0000874701 [Trichuris trichiura]